MMNLEPYISLLLQVPLVGIFVWFSLQVINLFLKSLDARDQQWKAWLEAERRANQEAVSHMASRFADEIRNLAKEIAEIRRHGEA